MIKLDDGETFIPLKTNVLNDTLADFPSQIDPIIESQPGTSGTQKVKVLTQSTLINDAIKAWNLAPKEIHESLSYNIAKKNIKMFAKTLPV